MLLAIKVSHDEKGPTTSTRIQGLLEIKIRLSGTLGVRAFTKHGLRNAVGLWHLIFPLQNGNRSAMQRPPLTLNPVHVRWLFGCYRVVVVL